MNLGNIKNFCLQISYFNEKYSFLSSLSSSIEETTTGGEIASFSNSKYLTSSSGILNSSNVNPANIL